MKSEDRSEDQLHISIAGFLQNCLAPEVWWTTFPAGGGGYDRGKILKAKGMKPGIPDIFPIIYRAMIHGIEVKTRTGTVSASQIECHTMLIALGCKIEICRSLDDVKRALTKWGMPWSEKSRSTQLLEESIARWQAQQFWRK